MTTSKGVRGMKGLSFKDTKVMEDHKEGGEARRSHRKYH